MYRDVLVNKWFLGAFIFCVICSIGCLIWYQMDMAKFRKEMKVYDDFSVQLADEKIDAKVAKRTNVSGKITQNERTENGETPVVNENTFEEAISGDKIPNTGAVNDATLPKTQNHRTNVSPYGFGPYPEIPEDFPVGKFSFKGFSKGHELLLRVWIKLWKQGERVEGTNFGDNGLVYPIIRGKAYVEWEEVERPDGTIVKSVSRCLGHPDDFPTDYFLSTRRPGSIREIPSHLEILSYDEGIDPYSFLDLQ